MTRPIRTTGFVFSAAAMQASRGTVVYTGALYVGTGIQMPDCLGTVDVQPPVRPMPKQQICRYRAEQSEGCTGLCDRPAKAGIQQGRAGKARVIIGPGPACAGVTEAERAGRPE